MRKRWIRAAIFVALAGIIMVVASTPTWSKPFPVSVVLAHRTIHVGSTDVAVVMNNSDKWLYADAGAGPWPDKGTAFTTIPKTAVLCIPPEIHVAPHARYRLNLAVYCSSWPSHVGRYWVVFPYRVFAHLPPPGQPVTGISAAHYLAVGGPLTVLR
jgi:hypothetical protein